MCVAQSTSVGKAVNKLRKHADTDVKALASSLKAKWTQLMSETDALARAPRFLPADLWDAIKAQYNQSQLQSVHSVLNNYNVGISLLQGPPGTGKTKTIMGLLSGFLALQPPALAIMPSSATHALRSSASSSNSSAALALRGDKSSNTTNFQSVRELGATDPSSARPTFSLSAVTSAMGSILRRSDADATATAPKRTTIQTLKNTSTVRSRLEDKLSARKPSTGPSTLVVRQRVVPSNPVARMRRSNHVLLCAPSNGAVDELVLRIVTDGLMDSSGSVVKVRAPSVHPEALSDEWLSVVRLGNPGEDAPDVVKAVCLPQIIKREVDIHPKAVQLRELQDTQQALRKSIRDFHQRAKEAAEAAPEGAPRASRKGLAQLHAQLTKCSGEVRRVRDEVFTLRTKLTAAILSRASIIACTLSKSGSGPLADLPRGFDALIIDEAAQAVELSTLVPIRERVARVVLVGDPKQLPATVKSVVAANARYDRSLFERIAESGVAPSMLRVQYRMHPFLREFPSKRFYGGMLTDGPSVMERVRAVCPGVYQFPAFQPFLLYDVTNSSEEDMNGSKYNRVEAQFCVDLCHSLFETCADARKHNWSVGFVSPYKEQVRVLRRELSHSAIPQSVSVEVNTVDGFQGREKDVIVFSCVRASKRGGIGFLKDVRRLNVAITRARFCLFVVGHVNTLVRDETWAALVRSAEDRRLVVRTRGASFPEVSRRLESDESKGLATHFQEMHEKAAKKQTGATTAAVNGVTSESMSHSASIKSEPDVPGVSGTANASGEPATATDAGPSSSDTKVPLRAQLSPLDTTTYANEATGPTTLPLSSTGSGSSHADASRAEDAPRKLENKLSVKSEYVGSVATPRSDRDRDRTSPATRQEEHAASRPSDDSRSDRDRASHRSRDRSSHRDCESHRSSDAYRKREHSSSSSRPHTDWCRSDRAERGDDRSKRPRYESSYDRRSPRASSSRHDVDRGCAPRPSQPASSATEPPPKSISAKEFCMENERPLRQADKPRSEREHARERGASSGSRKSEAQDRPKRPRDDEHRQALFPPGHKFYAREQRSLNASNASTTSYRSVALVTDPTAHQRPRNAITASSGTSRPTSSARGGGDGLLGSILGSASRLASATSRVQDKTVDRSSEFR